jgi:hypothetical protein
VKHLVESLHATFPLQDSMEHLRRLTAWDRFQASQGIVKAADYVADVLDRHGLCGVEVHHFTCPARWWTFDGPASWTPQSALLRAGGDIIVRYPDDPMCVATNSVPASRLSAPLHLGCRGDIAGAVVLHTDADLQDAIAAAERGGAVGIIADPLSGRIPGARGRLELSNATKLFGFSLTSAELALLRQATAVDVEMTVDRTAPMPVVEAYLPGADESAEIIVQAHLCHPRPGANDNCSGVAAALGLAAALASLARPLRRGIRFLFGPEFVGTAAYLHEFVRIGSRPRPIAAINLDMVGEDQNRCGGPLTIELPPDHLPSPLGAVAEHVLSLLPDIARSYSGALPARNWNAITVPFAGASDHAIYADRSVATPAIMIGHWPDRFNHTSFDTLDKVDPLELRRAATIAGACAWTMASANEKMHQELALIVAHHAIGRLLEAARSPRVDAGLLDHIAECSMRQLDALQGFTGRRNDVGRREIDEQRRLLCSLHDVSPRLAEASDRILVRSWPGPFNVRGLLQCATGTQADCLRRRIAEDKGAYTCVLALALAIDEFSSRNDVIRRAEYNSGLSIDAAFAHDFFDAMLAASWVREELVTSQRTECARSNS